jgi:hypothetical protein
MSSKISIAVYKSLLIQSQIIPPRSSLPCLPADGLLPPVPLLPGPADPAVTALGLLPRSLELEIGGLAYGGKEGIDESFELFQ